MSYNILLFSYHSFVSRHCNCIHFLIWKDIHTSDIACIVLMMFGIINGSRTKWKTNHSNLLLSYSIIAVKRSMKSTKATKMVNITINIKQNSETKSKNDLLRLWVKVHYWIALKFQNYVTWSNLVHESFIQKSITRILIEEPPVGNQIQLRSCKKRGRKSRLHIVLILVN